MTNIIQKLSNFDMTNPRISRSNFTIAFHQKKIASPKTNRTKRKTNHTTKTNRISTVSYLRLSNSCGRAICLYRPQVHLKNRLSKSRESVPILQYRICSVHFAQCIKWSGARATSRELIQQFMVLFPINYKVSLVSFI